MELRKTDRTRSVIFSVALHVIVAVVVVFGVDFGSRVASPPQDQGDRIVKAIVVDEETIEKEIKRLKTDDEKQQLEAERALLETEKKRKQEEQKLKELKAEQERIKQQKAKEREKLEAEKQRLAGEKKKLEAEERKKAEEQKRKAEEQKRVEAEEKKRKAEEQKRIEAEEQKRKAEEQKTAQALKDALATEEQENAAAEQLRQDEIEVNRYIAATRNKVTSVFIYPDLEAGLKCTLFVRMIPGGEVVEARVTQSSGSPLFDRQAENAVRKASPLPVPPDPRLFQRMREIRFVFDPKR